MGVLKTILKKGDVRLFQCETCGKELRTERTAKWHFAKGHSIVEYKFATKTVHINRWEK